METFVYFAHAPEDKDFVAQLSRDLEKANIQTWYDPGETSDENLYQKLQQATHVLCILSYAALLNERFLAALEFAKENRLERLAIRLTQVETMPPQLIGVLPLDFSQAENYQDGLTTLIEDLKIGVAHPSLKLPPEILKWITSDSVLERKIGVEALAKYRTEDDAMRQLALNELEALSFSEPDSALKALVRATIQTFAMPEPPHEPILPSKEELEIQARNSKQPVILADEKIHHYESPSSIRQVYLWQHNIRRWYGLLISLAIGMGLIAFAASSKWAYLVPVTLTAAVLGYFNIWIRQSGTLEWEMPKPMYGNGIVGVILITITALMLRFVIELEVSFLVINILLGAGLSLFIGWLSAVKLEIADQT